MSVQQQPSPAPAPQNVPQAPGYPSGSAGVPSQGGGPTVQNPALGNHGNPVQLPQQPQAPQQPSPVANPYGVQQPDGLIQHDVQNPYGAKPQDFANPFQTQQQNPYGAPQQGSPYTQQPNPYQTQNPAYNFQPQVPQQQQPVQQPQQPQAPLLPQQGQPQQEQQQQPYGSLTTEQLAQQPGGISQEQVSQIFPDETSQAIFQGMTAVASGSNIDLLQAFGSAYERRDPSLINERYLAQFDPSTVATLKAQFNALHHTAVQRDTQMTNSIYEAAGGEAQWNAAVAAFNSAADERTRASVRAAVDSGDPNQIHLAVQTVLRTAANAGNLIQRSGQGLTPNGAGQAPRDLMTKEAFSQHLTWLEQAFPVGSPEYNQHYQNLVAQRRAAKSQGY